MRLKIENFTRFHELFGNLDQYIRIIEKSFGVRIECREEYIIVDRLGSTDENDQKKALDSIKTILESDFIIDKQTVTYVVEEIKQSENSKPFVSSNKTIIVTQMGKPIKPKTKTQSDYVDALESYDVTFGVGPAGTGKTFLAVATAVKYLKSGKVSRIIITRPAVEAGENLGFLPGDLQDKVDPYLRPIFDAMHDILGVESFIALREKGIIEIAPLAYMRGRTLDSAFVILDEAQNTTPEQMKMFLTRFGERSKVAVNGDITQIDLPRGKKSGLIEALEALKDIEEIAFIRFSDRDVVRHTLVRKIIRSYENYEREKAKNDHNQLSKRS